MRHPSSRRLEEESEERLRGLLESLPGRRSRRPRISPRWSGCRGIGKGVGTLPPRLPYCDCFSRYFVTYHIGRSLDNLNRQFPRRPLLSPSDSDANKLEARGCETLPSVVAFAALSDPDLLCGARCAGDSASSAGHSETHFTYSIWLGAMLRFDVTYVGCSIRKMKRPLTVRSLIVLLIGLIGGGRPADLSVWLEAHTLQLVSVDQRAPRLDRGQEPRLQGRRNLRP